MNSSFAVLANNGLQAKPGDGDVNTFTVTALRRWSVIDAPLPQVKGIKAIHVYDFDNTLFATPLPNGLLWTRETVNLLQQVKPFVNGGWWHDATILSSTGGGLEAEEARAWQGWWNEDIVTESQKSYASPSTLSILLTGRSEANFPDLIRRIVRSRDLKFHMICLKPKTTPNNKVVKNTFMFKEELLRNIIATYVEAVDVKIWEDRIHHVHKFRSFLNDLRRQVVQGHEGIRRKGFTPQIKHVIGLVRNLDQVVEISVVQRLLNQHNLSVADGSNTEVKTTYTIQANVAYTAYYITSIEQQTEIRALCKYPSGKDIVTDGSHVLICQGPLEPSVLKGLGGVGVSLPFRATHFGSIDNKVWAVAVEPADPMQKTMHEARTAFVVVARKQSASSSLAAKITGWQRLPKGQRRIYNATLGERVILSIIGNSKARRPDSQTISRAAKSHVADVVAADEDVDMVRRNVMQSITGNKRPRAPSISEDEGEVNEDDDNPVAVDALIDDDEDDDDDDEDDDVQIVDALSYTQAGSSNRGGRPAPELSNGRGKRGRGAPITQRHGNYKGRTINRTASDNHRGGSNQTIRGRGRGGGGSRTRDGAHGQRRRGQGHNYQDLDNVGGSASGGGSMYNAY